MKSDYISPDIEIIKFLNGNAVTTSFSIDEFDDGAFYGDKW